MQFVSKLWMTSPFIIMGVWGFMKNKDEGNETKVEMREVLLAKTDALFDQGDYKSIYDVLSKHKVIKFSLNVLVQKEIDLKIFYISLFVSYRIIRMLKSCGVCVELFIIYLKQPVMLKHGS